MTEKPHDPWVTETGSRVKAWFLMLADVPMTEAKFGVQIGHGTDFIHIRQAENPFYATWIDAGGGNRRKIILRVKNLADLEKVERACNDAGMITNQIWDAGLTEFGRETLTGLVVHPHDDAKAPKPLTRAQTWKQREPA